MLTQWLSQAGAHWGTVPHRGDCTVSLSIANLPLNSHEIKQRSIAVRVSYAHRTRVCRISDVASEQSWGAVKFQGENAPDRLNASALHTEVCTNVVCPCCALASAMSWLRHCAHLTLTHKNVCLLAISKIVMMCSFIFYSSSSARSVYSFILCLSSGAVSYH